MADKEKKEAEDEGADDGPKLEPISPAKRRRLQKAFDAGNQQFNSGQFDYANDLFAQCVAGDPSTVIYVQHFLNNLIRKYNNNKKGSKMAGLTTAGAKMGLKRANSKKDYQGAIKSGLGILKYNPWDSGTLIDLSKACEELECMQSGIAFLRLALDGNPDDLALNKTAANAFERLGEYDQAILCLSRVRKEKPNDDGIKKQIDSLTIEKTLKKGGYEDADSSRDASVNKRKADSKQAGEQELTLEQQLRRTIRRNPTAVSNYLELSDLYFRAEDEQSALDILKEGLDGCAQDRKIQERIQDIGLHQLNKKIMIAERKAKAEKTEEAVKLYGKLKVELNHRELEKFRSRVETYPNNFEYKYELGLRLKRSKLFEEAVNQFQEARNEPKRTALANLHAGECFQYMKQFPLAMQHFGLAIETATLNDKDTKKMALYRAGVLSTGMKNFDEAKTHLTELATIDFSYMDVADRLKKLEKKRKSPDNGESEAT